MVLGGQPPGRVRRSHVMFQGSSMVEHSAVNRQAEGSSPSLGAKVAEVAELADAQDLKSCGTYTPVSVRFRSPAYFKEFVGIAQLDRAFGYGPKGRGFESSNARCKRSFVRKTSFLYVPSWAHIKSAQIIFIPGHIHFISFRFSTLHSIQVPHPASFQ